MSAYIETNARMRGIGGSDELLNATFTETRLNAISGFAW
jgi:hypothetical protein